MRGLFWFQNDLRLLDHPLLVEATKECDELLLLYILDPRSAQECPYGFPRTSNRRNYFTIQGVNALRAAIALRGGNLITCIGSPEDIIPKIVSELAIQNLYRSNEIGTEEESTAEQIARRLPKLIVKTAYTGSLIYPEDLPFLPKNTPEVFTSFRKAVEKKLRIALPVSEPTFRGTLTYQSMELPSLEVSHDPRSALPFEGGEVAALARLKLYLFEGDHLRTYKETRNGLIGANYSSKFSAWLAQGALSPRTVFAEIKRYEAERVANDSTYWLFFELLWREFFRCIALKHGAKLFLGLRSSVNISRFNKESFKHWCNGETGMPFIDANMRELNATGYMSNRGRQNVASFLVHDLKLPWQAGAYYFESKLVDYDVASNWGNWAYVAGVGNDPRRDRYFNVVKQSQMYDPEGLFIKLWCPELSHIATPELFEPR